MHGEIVGIKMAIIPNGQGIGFAIPILHREAAKKNHPAVG